MNALIDQLLGQTVRKSTSHNYHSIWKQFNNFFICLDYMPDDWEHRTAMFCAYLIDKGNQSATVKSYVSAIKTILKADKYDWKDGKIWLNSLIRVCKISNDTLHCHLPIHKGLLEMILFEIPRIYPEQEYLCKLYQAIITLGYYGLMRISELTKDPKSLNDHSIKNNNINVGINKQKILIVLYTSKTHDRSTYPQQIKISTCHSQGGRAQRNRFFCPFRILRDYINARTPEVTDLEANFFVFRDGSPVGQVHVRQILYSSIARFNLDPALYNCQSLRIGHASDLFKAGVPIEVIKRLGWWKSNAIYKYLHY